MNVSFKESNKLVLLISELPEDLALIITLYEIEKLKQNEIARKMNKSVSFVRSRIAKGKYLIKKKINDEELLKANDLIYSKKLI